MKNYVTSIMSKRATKYKRLCLSIKTTPFIFQATMDKILASITNLFCYGAVVWMMY